jgi:hypothetical protein
MMLLNTGRSKKHPKFDRYTFEEKAEYWALVWGTVAMGVTGIMQWFPVLTTQYLPGWAIPMGRALHRWEAILAVLAIVTWHFYHAVLKKVNTSIFTGHMSIADMEEEHPLELAYLEMAAEYVDNKVWPVLLHIPLDDEPEEGAQGEVQKEAVTPAESTPETAPDSSTTVVEEGSAQ